jgi:hypothetical protein
MFTDWTQTDPHYFYKRGILFGMVLVLVIGSFLGYVMEWVKIKDWVGMKSSSIWTTIGKFLVFGGFITVLASAIFFGCAFGVLGIAAAGMGACCVLFGAFRQMHEENAARRDDPGNRNMEWQEPYKRD